MFTFPVGFFNLIASGGGGGTTDPFAANVVLFLKGDGINGSTNIIDSSPSPKTISVFGNAQISTAQSKYGGSSLLFDGSGDYLTATSSTTLQNSDYTIEAWVYAPSTSGTQMIASTTPAVVSQGISLKIQSGGFLGFESGGGAPNLISSLAVTANQFNHLALSKQGNNYIFAVNGVTQTISDTTTISGYGIMAIGSNARLDYPYFLNGYIDSLRITQGVARYAANFNPETDTYLDISTNPTPTPNTINRCLATNGGIATASSTINNNYPASSTINGDRKGLNWGNGGGWNDAGSLPASLEVAFSTAYSITKINVITLQDNYSSPVEPTTATTFSSFGVTSYSIEYWNGSAWIVIDSTTGNNKVYKEFTFSAVTTTKIRVYITASVDGVYARLVEVEAY